MSPAKHDPSTPLTRAFLEAFDAKGVQPGFRPAHAKGVLISGIFTPSAGAKSLTRAPHLDRPSTPVTVRFSDSTGNPAIPDNDPQASPRGIAIRFHLAEHMHTDIIGHSVDGFPTRTPEEFLEFMRAAGASGPNSPKPSPIEVFLGSHPAALAFVQTPKPCPISFAKETFFGVNAHKFTNGKGASQYGRYRIRPDGESAYLTPEAVREISANFLFDEIADRVAKSPTRLRVMVQLAAPGDATDDATVHWPEDRPEVEFGTVQLTGVVANEAAEQRHIIFDPIARVDGIEPSADPLLEARADLYLLSGRRRRASGGGA